MKILTQMEYKLPPHERCAAHTLNLVASCGQAIVVVISFKEHYRSSYTKCKALWNKASRPTVPSDHVEGTVKKENFSFQLKIYRNSCFDAVLRIIENGSTELNELCTKLEVRCFSERKLVCTQATK